MDASFYLPKTKDGKIVAFADVDLSGGVIVKGFRIVRRDQELFAAVPSRSFTVEGKTRWVPQVVFSSPEIRRRFLSTLLDRYQRWEQGEDRSGVGDDGGAAPSHSPADELVE
jgi:DNA-binding cell septation regulator SpoVG